MIVVFFLFVEVIKWAVFSVVALLVVVFFASLIKKKVDILGSYVFCFIAVSVSHFLYWGNQFEHFSELSAELCKEYTNVKFYAPAVKENVALKGRSIERYSTHYSANLKHWKTLAEYKINSLVVYDKYARKSLDGVGGEWKKLSFANRGNSECKVFEDYLVSHPGSVSSRELRIKDKCVVIKVVDDVDSINFIDKNTVDNKVYESGSFYINLKKTKITNLRNGDVYIDLKKVVSKAPRVTENVYALFFAGTTSCKAGRYYYKN